MSLDNCMRFSVCMLCVAAIMRDYCSKYNVRTEEFGVRSQQLPTNKL